MYNINRYNKAIIGYIFFLFALFSVNLVFQFDSMWGLNQLLFIEKPEVYLFIAPFILVLLSSTVIKESFWGGLIDNNLYNWIFVSKPIFYIFLTLLLICLYLFKIETFFLGDGYAWIASFSNPDYFFVKPTELLSSYVIRGLQYLLGGFTKETSLLAFQIVSLSSGFLFFLILKNILDLLLKDSRLKVFTYLSFLFSGLTLLFMGYVEFYPILWMTASAYIYISIKSIHSPKYLIWAALLFVIMVLIHAQTIFLSLGFIYLFIWRKFNLDKVKQSFKKNISIKLLILVALTIVLISLLYQNAKIAPILLPLFTSNPEHPAYFVFSVSHLIDILNLTFLLFPIFIVFVFLVLLSVKKLKIDNTAFFLIISSVGSLAFLLSVNPYIGFARDWDLMSITLFLPILLTFYLFDSIEIKLHGRTVLIALALLIMLSSSYLYVNVSKDKSLLRYESIIKAKKGLQFRPGWTILNNYYVENNLLDKSVELKKEIKQQFSEYDQFANAYNLLERGKLQDAFTISTDLLKTYPENIDFIQLRGSVFMYFQNYDSAQYYLDKALSIQSSYPSVLKVYGDLLMRKGELEKAIIMLEEANFISHGRVDIIELLCSCYIRNGKIKEAVVFAKEFYLQDKQSPSYSIISLFINLQIKNKRKAIYHYKQFMQYGKKRDDYEQIKQTFSFLLKDTK